MMYDDSMTRMVTPRNALGVAWARRWSRDGRGTYQALYAVDTASTGVVGVRVTVAVASAIWSGHSAVAEVFDGIEWHAVAGLPPDLMRSRYPLTDYQIVIDAERLIEDVRLAYTMRAIGPGVSINRLGQQQDYIGTREPTETVHPFRQGVGGDRV